MEELQLQGGCSSSERQPLARWSEEVVITFFMNNAGGFSYDPRGLLGMILLQGSDLVCMEEQQPRVTGLLLILP
jgi:hypothetical protein